MVRWSLALALVAAFLAGSFLSESVRSWADDQPAPTIRPMLYPKWRMLGLSTEQTQKIYSIQREYRTKIANLEAEIKKLKDEEIAKARDVLTPAQQQRLRELLLGEPDAPSAAPSDKPSDNE